ncbi:MAG: outer membrane beta-barrel domain-containing protein, partial [Clostridia bacterium]|nr:outer membrane beta-barrel domain-containing protein [Deltaproteobacteria bacterium]
IQGEYYATANNQPDITGGGNPQANFNHQKYVGRAELIWAPIYGKLNLFAEEVFHFDTFLSAGGGYMGFDSDGGSVVGTLALGQHYFLSDWMALRIDIRDQIYSMDVNPSSGGGKNIQNLLTFNLGLSFYLPTKVASTQ